MNAGWPEVDGVSWAVTYVAVSPGSVFSSTVAECQEEKNFASQNVQCWFVEDVRSGVRMEGPPSQMETKSGARADIIARIDELLACTPPPPGAMLKLQELYEAAAEQHAMYKRTNGSFAAALDGVRTSRVRQTLHSAAAVEKMYRARGLLRTGPSSESLLDTTVRSHVLHGKNSSRHDEHEHERKEHSRHPLKRYTGIRAPPDSTEQRLQQLQMRQQRRRVQRENDAAALAREAAVAQAKRAVRAHVTSQDVATFEVQPIKLRMGERERPSTAGPTTLAEQRTALLCHIKDKYRPASQAISCGHRGVSSAGNARKVVAWPSATSAPAPTLTPSLASRKSSSGGDPLTSFGYSTQSPIAAGAFSTIVRARHISSGEEVAVKTFATRAKGGKQPPAAGVVAKEMQALETLRPSRHPYIANLVQAFETDSELHCILEYCSGGSVKHRLNQQGHSTGLSETDGANFTAQVGCALAHMHALGVTHRDVKPDNVIFTDRRRLSVRVVDFGFAGMTDGPSGRLRTVCGSPAYMSPELLAGKPYLGPPVDVWALGCFFYELVHNKMAFRGESIAQLNMRIRKGNHTPFHPGTSNQVKHAVRRMLTVDVGERVSSAAVTRALIERFGLTIATDDRLAAMT